MKIKYEKAKDILKENEKNNGEDFLNFWNTQNEQTKKDIIDKVCQWVSLLEGIFV
jgi:hypothetical protein